MPRDACRGGRDVEVDSSSPRIRERLPVKAPVTPLNPLTYSGYGGVGTIGSHDGSRTVSGFPSLSASWMAVIGRQYPKWYFESHTAIIESVMLMSTAANRRAVSLMSIPCRAVRSRSAAWYGPIATSVVNSAVSVCSAVRVEPTFAPSALTSLKSAVY